MSGQGHPYRRYCSLRLLKSWIWFLFYASFFLNALYVLNSVPAKPVRSDAFANEKQFYPIALEGATRKAAV